jgi:hypothetical protein
MVPSTNFFQNPCLGYLSSSSLLHNINSSLHQTHYTISHNTRHFFLSTKTPTDSQIRNPQSYLTPSSRMPSSSPSTVRPLPSLPTHLPHSPPHPLSNPTQSQEQAHHTPITSPTTSPAPRSHQPSQADATEIMSKMADVIRLCHAETKRIEKALQGMTDELCEAIGHASCM